MFPFVDIASGGNVLKFAENIKNTLESTPDDVKIIPGHEPLSNKEELIQIGLPQTLKYWETGFIKAFNTINYISVLKAVIFYAFSKIMVRSLYLELLR